MERKGQAAMEFLMTYGWAILAAIIAIAVLAYFGVFSPGRYVGSACVLSQPLSCEEYAISAGTGITLAMRNGYGDAIDITSITVDLPGCVAAGPYNAVADGSMVNGANNVVITGCTLIEDSVYRGDITVTYRKTGGAGISQSSTGTIRGKATA